jgi:hypothetical protein
VNYALKSIIFAPQNQALMSKHNLQIEEKILIKGIFGKSNIVSTILYIATPIWFICG